MHSRIGRALADLANLTAVTSSLRTAEQWIGVDDENFERVRDVDSSETVKGIVSKRRNSRQQSADNDCSWEAYLTDRTENTIKARMDKRTGRLLGFISFCSSSPPNTAVAVRLQRQECLERALVYLRGLAPEWLPYLRLLQEEDSSVDEQRELFRFKVFVQGIPVFVEQFDIGVNWTNGVVEQFSGSELRPEELTALSPQPSFNAQEAARLFLDQIEFELVWNPEYSQENSERTYQLVYRLISRHTKRTPRVIHAHSGHLYESALN